MKTGNWLGALTALGLLVASGAMADVERGLKAKAKEDYKSALIEFRKSADAGEPEAMVELGNLYLNGQGVPEDRDVYADLIQRAAEQGYAPAENSMGWIYSFWRDKPEIGIKWFIRAADQDNISGLLNAAYSYRNGLGVEVDGPKAIDYYKRADDLGRMDAGYQIGVMHHTGKVVPKDFDKAAEYFKRGAEQEHAQSEFFLAYIYRAGEGVEEDYEAFKEYRERAAEHGLIRAQLELGEHFAGYFAWDETKSYQKGAEWYERAAKQGSLKGMNGVLQAYRDSRHDGEGELNTEFSFGYWLERAAEQGDPLATWELAIAYDSGTQGKKRDKKLAEELANAAAEANHPDAMRIVGLNRMQKAKSQDAFEQAFEMLYGAATQENATAMLTVSNILAEGSVMPKNMPAAYLWALQAQRDGYGPGRQDVDKFLEDLVADMDPGEANRTQLDYNLCRNFYTCVLEASNFHDSLKERLRKYTPDYFR